MEWIVDGGNRLPLDFRRVMVSSSHFFKAINYQKRPGLVWRLDRQEEDMHFYDGWQSCFITFKSAKKICQDSKRSIDQSRSTDIIRKLEEYEHGRKMKLEKVHQEHVCKAYYYIL